MTQARALELKAMAGQYRKAHDIVMGGATDFTEDNRKYEAEKRAEKRAKAAENRKATIRNCITIAM